MPAAPNTRMPSTELEQLVARIAADVVRRLTAGAASHGTSPPAAPAAASMQAAEPPAAAPMLAEKVVVLASVAKLPRDLREVTVRHDAVLTPSAREWLTDRRITFRRMAQAATSAAAEAGSPAFLVAACDLPGRCVAQAAAVARAVPHGQQLPAAGIASLVDAFAEAASRSGSRGLLLSPRPAAAALIANRKRTIRAVVATGVRDALQLAQECRATLVVVDPSRLGPGGLQRLAVEFAKQLHQPLPADLAAASRPCSCSSTAQEATP